MDNSEITIHNGAVVNGVQQDTQVIMRRNGIDKWPDAVTGLKEWADKVTNLKLFDVQGVPIRNVRMNPETGGLYGEGKDPAHSMPMTKTAMGHLFSYVKRKPDNVVNNLLDIDDLAIRSIVFSHYMGRPEARNIVLRTAMTSPTQRTIRAVVSDLHSQERGDDLSIIESLKDLVTTEMKMRVVRQWDRTHAEIILPNTAVQVLKKGITLYGKINIVNSETKQGGFEALAGSMNLVCLNGMTAMGDSSTFKVRHVGDIKHRVRQSIRVGIEGVMEHLNDFSKAYSKPLPNTRAEAIEAFVTYHALPETTGVAMAALWDVDGERSGGDTLAGLVNSATRHAQSLPVKEAAELERNAGETLKAF